MNPTIAFYCTPWGKNIKRVPNEMITFLGRSKHVLVCFPVPGANATTEQRQSLGRPTADFDQMSDRYKWRRTADIRANYKTVYKFIINN